MNHLSETLDRDFDINLLLKFDEDWQSLIEFLIGRSDEQGIYLLSLLIEIAHVKNTVFWYTSVGNFLAFWLSYLDGAQKTSLSYFLKAYKLDKSNISILESILDFGLPPDIILSSEDSKFYAKLILDIAPEHHRAISILEQRDC